MEQISFNHLNIQKNKKKVYRFQEACIELANLAKVKPGLCFALWKRIGNEIYKVLAEVKQGEIKKPEVYIKYLLKSQR